jgi:hypothetical protein
MKYADMINGLNTDADAAKYELLMTIINEAYGLIDTLTSLIVGLV